MNVLMVSDFETRGGAAIAASRLAHGLLDRDVHVTRAVAFPDEETHPWDTRSIVARLERPVAARPELPLPRRLGTQLRKGLASLARRRLVDLIDEIEPDVINLHNLHWPGWPPRWAATCAKRVPTLWTLHDKWSFTGRCVYSFDCRRFTERCNAECPTADEYPVLPPEDIRDAFEERRRLIDEHRSLHAVAPSEWMAGEASSGCWPEERVHHISNGLDLDRYKPGSSSLARDELGLPPDGTLALIATQGTNERRKGGQILPDLLDKLPAAKLDVLAFGSGALPPSPGELSTHELGYVSPQQKIRAFNAADLLVHPAPIDNLPNIVMESIACGTPVAGFPVGGVTEMVRPGETGWLAEEVTAEALASAVERAVEGLGRNTPYREKCRRFAEKMFAPERNASSYVEIATAITGR